MFDINEIRSNFPVVNNLIYFDHAAVAPIHSMTKIALNEYIEHFQNYGIRDYQFWFEKCEGIRIKFAQFIGAEASEIAFIKNTSAGISIIANGVDFIEGDNVIVPDIEFPANVYPWMSLERKGVNTKFLKTENGTIDLNRLSDLIDSNTRLVAISWVEFSSGFRNDLNAISELCKEKSRLYGRKIYFCVDAIQGLGALKLDLKETEIDFLAADGHKWFMALEGAGILYVNKNVIKDINPVIVGWKSVTDPLDFTYIHYELQKSALKFEEGSMNVAGIVSIGASLDLFNKYGIEFIEERVLNLSKYASNLLLKKELSVTSTQKDNHRSGIVTFKPDNIDEVFLKLLAHKIQLSKRGESLRISPHFYNTEEEIEKCIMYIQKK